LKIDIENRTNGKRAVWKFRAGGIIWDEDIYKYRIMNDLSSRAHARKRIFVNENNGLGISFTSQHINNLIESTFEKGTPKVFKSLREILETIRD